MINKKYIKRIRKNLLLIISVMAIATVIALWIGTYYFFQGDEHVERGTFGDMYGTVNALFSGLAFSGIVITILLQRKELIAQRKELKLTRKQFKIQNDTLSQQRFENTFFNLLTIHHKIVEAIDFQAPIRRSIKDYLDPEYEILKGRDVFKLGYENFKTASDKNKSDFEERIYLEQYEKFQTDFGHYFRNLYRLIKLVDNANFISLLNPKESLKNNYRKRYSYTSIVRSNLSDYELLWIFYNSLSKNGNEKFMPLIVRYTLLKNLPKEKLINKKHENLIHKQAFEKNKEKLNIL